MKAVCTCSVLLLRENLLYSEFPLLQVFLNTHVCALLKYLLPVCCKISIAFASVELELPIIGIIAKSCR